MVVYINTMVVYIYTSSFLFRSIFLTPRKLGMASEALSNTGSAACRTWLQGFLGCWGCLQLLLYHLSALSKPRSSYETDTIREFCCGDSFYRRMIATRAEFSVGFIPSGPGLVEICRPSLRCRCVLESLKHVHIQRKKSF